MDWSHKVGGIHVKRNWPAKVSAKQGLIVRFDDGDGKSGGKTRDPAECRPPSCLIRTDRETAKQSPATGRASFSLKTTIWRQSKATC